MVLLLAHFTDEESEDLCQVPEAAEAELGWNLGGGGSEAGGVALAEPGWARTHPLPATSPGTGQDCDSPAPDASSAPSRARSRSPGWSGQSALRVQEGKGLRNRPQVLEKELCHESSPRPAALGQGGAGQVAAHTELEPPAW